MNGFKQARVLARKTGRRHPIGAEFDIADCAYISRRDIGNRFAHRHPPRGRRIDDRNRCALAHRHCFAVQGLIAHQRDRAIGHRHLPRADELIARGQPADRAVPNGDQK